MSKPKVRVGLIDDSEYTGLLDDVIQSDAHWVLWGDIPLEILQQIEATYFTPNTALNKEFNIIMNADLTKLVYFTKKRITRAQLSKIMMRELPEEQDCFVIFREK